MLVVSDGIYSINVNLGGLEASWPDFGISCFCLSGCSNTSKVSKFRNQYLVCGHIYSFHVSTPRYHNSFLSLKFINLQMSIRTVSMRRIPLYCHIWFPKIHLLPIWGPLSRAEARPPSPGPGSGSPGPTRPELMGPIHIIYLCLMECLNMHSIHLLYLMEYIQLISEAWRPPGPAFL